MVNGTDDERIWDHMVRTWHYLGYDHMIGPRIKYLVLFRDMPITAICFNRASRVVELQNDKDGDGLWLYVRKYEDC